MQHATAGTWRHWSQSIELRWLALAGLWVVTLLAVSRLPWVERELLIPFAHLAGSIAARLLDARIEAVIVNASCTGADAAALALASVLAFPARWRQRLLGVAVVLVILTVVNAARIGTLAAVAERQELFQLLHVYVWPAMLIVAAAGSVALWMAAVGSRLRPASWLSPRNVAAGAALVAGVAAHYALFPWLATQAVVATACRAVAATSAGVLGLLGGSASATGAVLTVEGRHWLVTPDCILTPILPVFLIAVGFLIRRHRWRLLAWAAALPLFFALAVVRALVLGAPAALVGRPEVAVHAFFQVAAGVALIGLAWHLFGSRRGVDLATALPAGAGVAWVSGWLLRLLPALPAAGHWGHGHSDAQGALSLFGPLALGLFTGLALVLRLRRATALLAGAGALLASHGLLQIGYGELVEHLRLALPIASIRALGVLAPLAAITMAVVRSRRRGATRDETTAVRYRGFWNRVGEEFPDLSGAATTRHYRDDEILLIRSAFPQLDGTRLLKTDLWDEARNTKILCWAAAQGARTFGVDISLPTILKARDEFRRRGLRFGAVAADVRALPFRQGAFDGVYSMGTIEHFPETESAAAEIGRVTRDGGRAVIGVPNRHDPFLRPLAVALLHRFGMYGYGDEKSYTRAELTALCGRAGLRVVGHGGVLFLPGLLRMADLAVWTWARPLSWVTASAAAPFAWLARHIPRLRRHGYLIAVTGEPEE